MQLRVENVACGGNSSSGFWDPCHQTCNGSNTSTWCWSVGWWWGWGWGVGYQSPYWGAWWGGPWWWDQPAYYAPYPIYYSTVIYDAYPQPAPYVVEAPPTEPSAQSGEGSIQIRGAPGSRATENGLAAPRGLQELPRSTADHLARGDQAFREARYPDAVREYAKAVETSPDQGVLHLVLSDGLFATGDYHYSAYALRRALELDPTLVNSVLDKHSFYGDPIDCNKHLEALERYVGEHPKDDDARLLLVANDLFANRLLLARDLLEDPSGAETRNSATGQILLDRVQKTLSESGPAASPETDSSDKPK
jgi:tetratricopeptide (TPR) repeat protein